MAQGAGLEFFLKSLKTSGHDGAGRMGAPRAPMRFSPESGKRKVFVHATDIRPTTRRKPCSCASYAAAGSKACGPFARARRRCHTSSAYTVQGTASAPGLPRGKSNSGKILQMTTSASGAIDTARGSSVYCRKDAKRR